jgi:hypothetical protein
LGIDPSFERHVWSLVLDNACRQIVRHLQGAGHAFVMLKGATIASWLYSEPTERTYIDLDILVNPAAEEAVVASLEELGYLPLLDPATLRSMSPEEQPLRNAAGVFVDLHVTLKGIRLPAERAWDVLSRETAPWDWGGITVPALSWSARAMHLALHAAAGGRADEKAVRDLQLGLERVDDATWHAARDLAGRLDALEAFAAGLLLLPRGRDLAHRMGLDTPTDVETQMRAGSASNSAVTIERVISSRSWRGRLALLRTALFPSAEWMRLFQPEATETRWGVLRARIRRPLSLLLRVPGALWEGRRYRRSPRADGE